MKTEKGAMENQLVVAIVVVLVVVGLVWVAQKSAVPSLVTTTEGTVVIDRGSDLQMASDELDTVNVDAVDSGISELAVEVSRY